MNNTNKFWTPELVAEFFESWDGLHIGSALVKFRKLKEEPIKEDTFIWTDELVEELIWNEYGDSAVVSKINKFKKLKQQPKEDKGWEVLTYKHITLSNELDNNIIIDKSSRHFEYAYGCPKDFCIHSVLRKSDNEVFTVGDTVIFHVSKYGSFVIDNFFITSDKKILARSKDHNICELLDSRLIKISAPKEDKGCSTQNSITPNISKSNVTQSTIGDISGVANIPTNNDDVRCLSVNDVLTSFKGKHINTSISNQNSELYNHLKELVKSKQCQ